MIKWLVIILLFATPVFANDKEIACLADSVFFESRQYHKGSGKNSAYSEQLATAIATINRAKHYKRSICDTVYFMSWNGKKWVAHYSWRIMGKNKIYKIIHDDFKTYTKMYHIAENVYRDRSMHKILRKQDHFITKELADSGKAPRWFKHYCVDKVQYGKMIYCRGIPKVT